MTTYFVANELEDWPVVVGTSAVQTSSIYYRTGNRCTPGPTPAAEDTNYFESSAFSLGEFWTKMVFAIASTGTHTQNFIKWYAGGTQRLAFHWTTAATGTIEIRRWNGSSWDSLVTTTDTRCIPASATVAVLDFHIKLGNPGEFRVYFNNQIVISQIALDLSFGGAVTAIDKIRINPTSTTAGPNSYTSEVIIADYPTLFARVLSKPPTGNGTYQEWTNGAFGVVDEASAAADLAVSGTADQRTSYTHAAAYPALATNETLAAVKAACVVNRDAAGPQNINFFTRISTTDTHSANQAVNVAATNLGQMWETSPATAIAWTVTELNAAQFGVRSRT